MSDLKGIFFNNGMQGIGTVKQEGDFYIVEGLLQLIVKYERQVIEGQERDVPYTTFSHINPFVDEANIGVSAKVHTSACFLYEVASDIGNGYYTTTNRIQPISNFIMR